MTKPSQAKLIIDTDPGVDDAMAIMFALESGAFELVGLTTVFGNVEIELATENALRILEIAGKADIPVAQGTAAPLATPFHGPVPFVHGDDGLGNVHLPPPNGRPIEQSAAEFIIEQVMSQPGEMTLVPIGPLTNLAIALHLEPRIATHVKEVVFMGGAAFVPGNVTPAAEANILSDPEAANVVFRAEWPLTMIGLDITHKVAMTAAELALYAASPKATSQFVSRILPFYYDFCVGRLGRDALFMHDPTAISYLLHRDLFEVKPCAVKVETTGMSRGKTWAWPLPGSARMHAAGFNSGRTIDVVVGADVAAVNRVLIQTI